jgi:hypothetical protein
MDSDSDAILREPPMAGNDLIRESVDGLVGEDPE